MYAVDWPATWAGISAVAAVATILFSRWQVRVARQQILEAQRAYHVNVFFEMSKRMDGVRTVRAQLGRLDKYPYEPQIITEVRNSSASLAAFRDYCADLNEMAFLSEPQRGAIPREWIVEMWGRTIARTWRVLRVLTEFWRTDERQPALFHQL